MAWPSEINARRQYSTLVLPSILQTDVSLDYRAEKSVTMGLVLLSGGGRSEEHTSELQSR